ncbi:MAG TPA: FkbM family methyltransferase [Bacteroidia bacterium]|jgi:FkbM family methyltransferase|nr:FkbM family methyltransferase [Bacteroidia bacterium]
MYSQNQEEEHILNYFKDYKGTLLDIGANDGKTFSNSLRLIELGWKAYLVEPSPKAFEKLSKLHANNKSVECVPVAIGEGNSKAILAESGWHLNHKSDVALLSTLIPEEKKRWDKVAFEDKEVEVVDYKTFTELVDCKCFDFISIDAEGMDWQILSQIDLSDTKMLCIETNSVETEKYINYCIGFGMRLIYKNAENIIMAK